MAGRPKSNEVKRISGSRHYNANAPHFGAPEDLSVPRGLLPAQGRKFWHENLGALVAMGIVTEADLPAFVIMSQAWAFAQEAASDLREEGLSVADKKGSEKKHPAWQMWRDSATMFLKIAGSFGMLPDMRGRLDVSPVDDGEDEIMRLLLSKASQAGQEG